MPPGPRELLQKHGWLRGQISSPAQALRHLRGNSDVDMVVVVPGAQAGAFTEFCRGIKFDQRTSFLSVVFIVAGSDAGAARELLYAGADDCIPLSAPDDEILLRLRRALGLKRATDLLEDASAVILALANAVEGKDAYTCGHVDRVATYSVQIGKRVGIDEGELAALRTGGAVHDIGKIGIPDQILNKPGKLTDEEMSIIQRHPVIGYDILKPLRTFQAVLPIVRWHHEKPNGAGYPDGLKAEQIPLLARITAVADVFDALATDRPYRRAFPMPKCRAIMLDAAQKGELDGELVNALLEALDRGLTLGTEQAA